MTKGQYYKNLREYIGRIISYRVRGFMQNQKNSLLTLLLLLDMVLEC